MKTKQTQAHEAAERGEYGDGIGLNLEHDVPAQAQPQFCEASREAEHSPLPWAIRVTRANTGAPKNIRICDHIGLTTAIIHGSATAGVTVQSVNERKDANAAFVVRACNNAQRLADALTEMLSEVECFCADYVANKKPCPVHQAREALAQWEKQ